mmetsp:Transcript_30210/g.42174  ORF Transcript_30210/g.42174 Transcript_30210/m.42174 type:complete len:227 (+) Transcript_30210:418-1098(+)
MLCWQKTVRCLHHCHMLLLVGLRIHHLHRWSHPSRCCCCCCLLLNGHHIYSRRVRSSPSTRSRRNRIRNCSLLLLLLLHAHSTSTCTALYSSGIDDILHWNTTSVYHLVWGGRGFLLHLLLLLLLKNVGTSRWRMGMKGRWAGLMAVIGTGIGMPCNHARRLLLLLHLKRSGSHSSEFRHECLCLRIKLRLCCLFLLFVFLARLAAVHLRSFHLSLFTFFTTWFAG